MFKKSILTVAISAAVAGSALAATSDNPFVETNGRLIVETETGDFDGNWQLRNEVYGYTGAGYLLWTGSNNFGPDRAPFGNPISYHFRINTPGNYELRWRSRNTVGTDPTEHNDTWVRFPTGENIEGQHPIYDSWTKGYMGHVEQWTWDTWTVDHDNQYIRQYFAAGDHVIEIAGRSNGHSVDRFVLHQYETGNFNTTTFDALASSPLASQLSDNRHVYTGNSCVAQQLSLSADQSLHTDEGSGKTYLRFSTGTIDNIQSLASNASLLVSGVDVAPDVAVYLGSHSNWNTGTQAGNLPQSSALLGQSSPQAELQQSISIDASMLTESWITLILEHANNNELFGSHSGVEPRLNMTIPQAECGDYQSERSNTPFFADSDVTPEPEVTPEPTPDPEDTPDPDTSYETQTTDSEPTPVAVLTPEDTASIEAPPNSEIDTQAEAESELAAEVSETSGGALSTLSILLGLMMLAYRTREKRLREFFSRK